MALTMQDCVHPAMTRGVAASGATPFSGASSNEEDNYQMSTYGRIGAESQ
ncbi:MAG TPA: hypothetical protein VKY19_04260 [Ktedonosporobacter sp.]|jgi:hypothetical protein|nr:hypothetical protein [Ktedonosporobacter sp.]